MSNQKKQFYFKDLINAATQRRTPPTFKTSPAISLASFVAPQNCGS